jgi:YVTN family beta-propeller protein
MRALRVLSMVVLVAAVCPIMQAKTNYAYVANLSDNTVSVVNISNDTVVKTITVGTNPFAVAVDEAGKSVYVGNFGSNNVSVISTSTNAVTATIPVQTQPQGVAVSPNGKTVYVANGSSGTVSVINTATKKVTANISVPGQPAGVAVTPNGAFVYVANYGANNVAVINTITNAVVASVPAGTGPTWVAISPDGTTVYVTNQTSSSVTVIQTATNTVANTITLTSVPYGNGVSPDGQWLYVVSSGSVTVINTATQAVAATIPTGAGTYFLVSFSEDGAFAYLTESGTNTVYVINTESMTVAKTVTVGNSPAGVAVMGTVKVSTTVGGFVGDRGPATSAALEGPSSVLLDSAGNVYVSDVLGNRIRKIDTANTITTYAGTGMCDYNGDNIKATLANICPQGLAWDPAGNMIVADGGNGRIRRISKAGVITTIAGNGTFGPASGDGGPATSADIGQAFYIAYDSSGSLYFASVGECRVRKVDTTGTITTVAGTGTCGYNGDGIAANTAQLNFPRGVAVDGSNNLYIGDTANHRVRMVNSGGTISTFAGTGAPGYCCDGGPATGAKVGSPRGLTVFNGSLYITNGGGARIRAVDLGTGRITTYAGSNFGYDGDGHSLASSLFSTMGPITFDASGNAYIPDLLNARLRKATAGTVNTFAGGYIGDGAKAISAALVLPEALAIDKSGNKYIADYTGNRVRKVSGSTITTVAGTGVSGYSGDGGAGKSATLYAPQGVAADSLGNVFIADTFNNVVREVNPSGTISTFATNANFGYLAQMATDSSNNVYVADNAACVIWKITPGGVVAVAAGVLFTCGYNGDGISSTSAQLNVPNSVAFDSSGNMLIADYGNNRVREVNTSGIIGTVVGDGNCNDSGDGGSATAAEICLPLGVAVNRSSGTIYTTDSYQRVRKISGGTITAYGGTGIGAYGFTGDGLWPLLANFEDPVAVAVDPKGVVNVLDDVDHRVRQIQ